MESKWLRALAASAALLLAGTAHAVPMLSFLIDGDTFSQPYSVTNSSTGGENVVRFQLNLGTIPSGTFCYDTVTNSVCNTIFNNGVPFTPVGGTGVTTGLVGAPVVPDGSQLLDISFTGFNPGETFIFDIDVDEAGNIGTTQTVTGNELIGATATIDFSDGQRLNGILAEVAGNPDASQFTVTGITQTPTVPEPMTLALIGLGLAGIIVSRRRKNT